jgi:hypothetical protein
MSRLSIALGLAVAALTGCGNVCGPATCSGCCDANGKCEQASAQFCGAQGEECVACGAGQTCSPGNGLCQATAATTFSSTIGSTSTTGSSTHPSASSTSSSGTNGLATLGNSSSSGHSSGSSGHASGSSGHGGSSGFAFTTSSGSSGYIGDCYPSQGWGGNAQGIGAYCTSSDNDCQSGLTCANNFDSSYQWCTLVGCSGDASCGAGSCCYTAPQFDNENVCVPTGCGLCPGTTSSSSSSSGTTGGLGSSSLCQPCSSSSPCTGLQVCVQDPTNDLGYCAPSGCQFTGCTDYPNTSCVDEVEYGEGSEVEVCYPTTGTCQQYPFTLFNGNDEGYGGLSGIAVDSTGIYFTYSSGIAHVQFDGGFSDPLYGTGAAPTLMTLDSSTSTLYFSLGDSIFSIPTAGGGSLYTAILSPSCSPIVGVAISGTTLYWTCPDQDAIYSGPTTPGEEPGAPLVGCEGGCEGLVLVGNDLYFPESAEEDVVWISLSTESPQVAFDGDQSSPYAIASEGTNVYWTDQSNSFILLGPVNVPDATPSILITGISNQGHGQPQGIAVDDTFVYWTTTGNLIQAAYKPLSSGLQ